MRLFLFLVILLHAFSVEAADTHEFNPACRVCHTQNARQMLSEVEELKSAFFRFREKQKELRKVYYDDLWAARSDANDPLEQEVRQSGKRRSEIYESLLSEIEAESTEAANQFFATLRVILSHGLDFSVCDPASDFQGCVQESLARVRELGEDLERLFNAVFESEREYTEAAARTAGGKKEDYPRYSVEKPVDHTDYYLRFEAGFADKRFQEETSMLRLLHELSTYIRYEFGAPSCCSPQSPVDLVPVDPEDVIL